jgi:PKHD-type hydroxylase
MRSEWCYYKQHFTPEQCKEIIKKAEQLPIDEPTLGSGTAERYDNGIRRSKVRWILRDSIWDNVFSELDKLVARANNEWFNLDYQYCGYLQFTEYDQSYEGCFKRHQDTFLTAPTNRKLSVTVQLTDPTEYQGGQFEFCDIGVKPKAENIITQGTVIIFPSIIFHEVKPVTQGKRCSLVGWYEGPPWR